MSSRLLPALVTSLLIFTACSGSDSSDSSTDDDASSGDSRSTETTEATSSDSAADDVASDADRGEVPEFAFELARLCTTQDGYDGLTPLAEGTGPNLTQLTEERDDGEFVNQGFPGPDGWLSNSRNEITAIELVACSSIGEFVDSGVTCDYDLDDGTSLSLTLMTGTYDLVVYEATTGDVVSTSVVEADSLECERDSFTLFRADQTEIFATPTQEAYIEALRPVIEPG
ncbi:MAG: hypothetical protein AB8G14_16790 [Ilumatobacter sp.]